MPLLEALYPSSAAKGVRWHKPSGCYIAEVGYHKFSIVAADGSVTTKRIRSTFYLGDADSRSEAESRFDSIKRDWVGWVSEQRKAYDAENQQRRSLGLSTKAKARRRCPRHRTSFSLSCLAATRTDHANNPAAAQQQFIAQL
jgi:hypothetical protein